MPQAPKGEVKTKYLKNGEIKQDDTNYIHPF